MAENEIPQSSSERFENQLSLASTLFTLGGRAKFEDRKVIFERALSDGLNAKRPRPVDEVYTGTIDQNSALRDFIIQKITREGYLWDPVDNYLTPARSNAAEEFGKSLLKLPKKVSLKNQLENHIWIKLKIKMDQINDANRTQVMKVIRQFLVQHPRHAVGFPVEIMNRVLGNRNGNMITIDDGPNANTTAILDILDQSGKRAIFYLMGENMVKNPEMVKEIAKRGHIIGYHSMDHTPGSHYTPDVLNDDFFKFKEALDAILGFEYPLVFCRMPYGHAFSFKSLLKLKARPESNYLSGAAYLSAARILHGNPTVRGWNWDVDDNQFRGDQWALISSEAKIKYYKKMYKKGRNRVFLLHQEDDDVATLRAMLHQ